MNTGIGGGRPPSDEWLRFRDFVRRVGTDLVPGKLVRISCVQPMGDEVEEAYSAPWPVPESKAGVLAFPDLVPISPEHPDTPAHLRVRERSAAGRSRRSCSSPTPTRSSRRASPSGSPSTSPARSSRRSSPARATSSRRTTAQQIGAPDRGFVEPRTLIANVTRLMVSDVIADPSTVANGLRPVLLRLSRELRRETEPLGVTSRQVTLLWLIRGNPGLSLRELAAEERISAPALSGHVDRLEKAGLIERVRDERRPPPRRPDADRRGRAAAQARPRPPHDLARRAAARARAGRARRGRGRASSRSEASVTAALLALNARTFASLHRHRNYRLFFTGQVISVSGTWMQNIALAWLVVELTHSPLAVGALAFCRFVPFTVFGLFAGVVADRIDNRRLVIGTQTASMVVSAALPVLVLSGSATLWLVYVLAVARGTALVFDAPGRHALTFQMVGRDELPNAVALNASLFNASRVVGPAVAGVVIAASASAPAS